MHLAAEVEVAALDDPGEGQRTADGPAGFVAVPAGQVCQVCGHGKRRVVMYQGEYLAQEGVIEAGGKVLHRDPPPFYQRTGKGQQPGDFPRLENGQGKQIEAGEGTRRTGIRVDRRPIGGG